MGFVTGPRLHVAIEEGAVGRGHAEAAVRKALAEFEAQLMDE